MLLLTDYTARAALMFGVRIADMNILNRGNDLVFAATEIFARPTGYPLFPFVLTAREGGLWVDRPGKEKLRWTGRTGVSDVSGEVCLGSGSTALGTHSPRRLWLPFIPPLTLRIATNHFRGGGHTVDSLYSSGHGRDQNSRSPVFFDNLNTCFQSLNKFPSQNPLPRMVRSGRSQTHERSRPSQNQPQQRP